MSLAVRPAVVWELLHAPAAVDLLKIIAAGFPAPFLQMFFPLNRQLAAGASIQLQAAKIASPTSAVGRGAFNDDGRKRFHLWPRAWQSIHFLVENAF